MVTVEKTNIKKKSLGMSYLKMTSGQSYKATTIVIYASRVVNIRNLLVTMTLES